MRNGKVGFAIIGTGVIAPKHAKAISFIPEAELIAVVDVAEEKAIEFQEKFKCVQNYASLEDCFQDDLVDVVIVCTPSGTHGDLVIQAAKAGKHVLCEKPLEIQADKMTAMIEACKKANVKLGAVYQRRALDTNLQIKRMMEEGVFGKLAFANAYLKYYRSQEYYDSAGWRGTWKMDGGGALMNQGVHGVDMIQWLNGGVKKVFARATAVSRNIEVEDTAAVVVEYNNGSFGIIEGSTVVYPNQATRFEINGDNGTVVVDDNGIQVCETLEGKLDPANWKPAVEFPEADVPPLALGHFRFVWDMTRAVLDDREPFVSGEEARKAVDLIHAIYESARTGKEVIIS
ncbi:Gfo/Idh/MocA family protein [Radiobacillus sp. PE A8.2]|uniref:Gfo/Idh/MocA family protein n=1 Tax=Radiobacillus sp. PE A8.2 TaxID=3380349 RepID=UPI00388CF796